jgi:hypothetical protein
MRGRADTNALPASVSGRLFLTTIAEVMLSPSSAAFSDSASNHEIDELERHYEPLVDTRTSQRSNWTAPFTQLSS